MVSSSFRSPGFIHSTRLDRTMRWMTAVASAGLLGTVIGGVSMFSVFSAMTPSAHQRLVAVPPGPARLVYGTAPDPSAGSSAGLPTQTTAAPAQASAAPAQGTQVPAQTQQQITLSSQEQQMISVTPIDAQTISIPEQQPTPASAQPKTAAQTVTEPQTLSGPLSQPLQQTAGQSRSLQKAWPDALSRAHPHPLSSTDGAVEGKSDAAVKDTPTQPDPPVAFATQSSAPTEQQQKPSGQKRVVVSHQPQPAVAEEADDSSRHDARRVYNYSAPSPNYSDEGPSANNVPDLRQPAAVRNPKNVQTTTRHMRSRDATSQADSDDAREASTPRRDHIDYDRGVGFFFGNRDSRDDDN